MSSRARTIGLALLGLLSVGDVALIGLTDGQHPPRHLAAVVGLLGLVSLWLVVRALRDPSAPVRLLIGLRVLSAISAVPAFLVEDVPSGAVAGAGIVLALTAAGVLLVATGTRRPAEAAL